MSVQPQADRPSPSVTSAAVSQPVRRVKPVYVPAITPRLRKLFAVVLVLLALLGANSGYLVSITTLEAFTGRVYQNYFYQLMFLGHLVLGLLFIGPFAVFAFIHTRNTLRRKNRRAVRAGYALLAASATVIISGLLLMRVAGLDLRQPTARLLVYWAHVLSPLAAAWLYWLHRLAGPPIRWRIGLAYGGVVGATIAAMVLMHSHDPRKWNIAGPPEGEKYFQPSLARTSTGNFIPASSLMMDDYCKKCHADVHAAWADSAHHFSSFNNPAYLASVRETREVSLKRDGNVKASRWCAGCHDPVPFFSGAFDDPNYDLLKHPTSQAGITCTVCHSVTHVNSTRGNADFTIEEPEHYPFASSENPLLQWVNNQLVRAKPEMHKKTFLKDFHKSADFCSTCHKVSLPYELNHYKEFLRGQNHHDTFLLSGVSGHGARSFYYPPKARSNCNECHMPLHVSNDFGAKNFDGSNRLTVHDHLFPAANTGVAWMLDREKALRAHQEFLKDVVRVDLFGVREDGAIDGKLHAPLRPSVPTLEPGKRYLLEAVIRTLKLGHPFTQGTADSNEIWLDITVWAGDRVIGRSGGIDGERGNQVDPWAHFVNVFMLDRNGNRINRRNPQDIFTPLYNHQIPPGAAATVHYGFEVPQGLQTPIKVDVRLQYRKFDTEYLQFVAKDSNIRGRRNASGQYVNELPITTLATDSVTFPVAGISVEPNNEPLKTAPWERWNDYGIGQLLKGKAELRQAADAFAQVEELGRYDGPLNLARVHFTEGQIDEAAAALQRASAHTDPSAPPWTVAWLSGLVNQQQGRLSEAEQSFRKVLEDCTPEMIERGFDFSLDYEVRNLLGQVLFDRARQMRDESKQADREKLLSDAVRQFQQTLALDSENVTAHYNLQLLFTELGNQEKAKFHRERHAAYKPDDHAAGTAVQLARSKYSAANYAAEAVVIYPLHRQGAPELPPDAAGWDPAHSTTSQRGNASPAAADSSP